LIVGRASNARRLGTDWEGAVRKAPGIDIIHILIDQLLGAFGVQRFCWIRPMRLNNKESLATVSLSYPINIEIEECGARASQAKYFILADRCREVARRE
jgi:hypothetical protein